MFSSLSSSLDLGAMTGLPAGKKKIRRGGRKKATGKPGSQHHQQMNQAYARGDYATAKKHALNFANAMHAHSATSATSATPDDGDADAMDASSQPIQMPAASKAVAKPVATAPAARSPAQAGPANHRAQLAAALKLRRKA